jgi:hypothetical protein
VAKHGSHHPCRVFNTLVSALPSSLCPLSIDLEVRLATMVGVCPVSGAREIVLTRSWQWAVFWWVWQRRLHREAPPSAGAGEGSRTHG